MKEKRSNLLSVFILGMSFLLLVALNLFCHDHWLDSDMAAEMIFSQKLSQTGHFFATPDWYYSTEFRFLYTHWIMGPLFHVFGSWHVIRMITNIITYLLMLVSYFFFMKPFGVRKSLVTGSAALLLLPFSETMMTHMQMGNTYPFHVIISFLFMGLYMRLVAGQKNSSDGKGSASDRASGKVTAGTSKNGAVKVLYPVFYVVIGLICGVSGVRYLLALQCPLILAGFLFFLGSSEFAAFRKECKEEEFVKRLCGLLKAQSLRYMLWAVPGVIAALAGYLINVAYVTKQYVFQTYDATNFIAVYQGILTERIQNAFGSLIMLFGYIPDKGVISLRGLISVISFVLIGTLGYCAVRCANGHIGDGVADNKNEKGDTVSIRSMATVFFWTAFALNLFIFVFSTSTMVPRYYITIFIFMLPLICFYLEGEERFVDRFIFTAVLSVCILLATGKTTLSFASTDKNAQIRNVAKFLEQSGNHFGYATYWNANIVTELTDGAVKIANVGDASHLDFFRWSSPKEYYDVTPQGSVFLLLTVDQYEAEKEAPSVQAGEVIYEDGAYIVLSYPSADDLLGKALPR